MADERGATRSGGRTDARSMIAELWAEREQAGGQPSPGAPRSSPPPAPRPGMGGRERLLAAAVVLLLIGGALGLVAVTLGIIGAPSKASFLAEADVICGSANGAVSGISKPAGYASLTTSTATLVTSTDNQLVRLRALVLPGGADRRRARAVLDAIAVTNDAGRVLQGAAGANDAAMTATASRSMSLYAQAAVTQAREYGFSACMTGMQPGIDAVVAGAKGVVKDSFVEKGNALCVQLLKTFAGIPKLRNNDIVRFVNQHADLFDKLANDLKALPVAPGDEATVTDMITSLGSFSGTMRQMGPAAAAGDVKRVNALTKEGDAMEVAVNAKLGAYGLTVCGSPE